MPVKHWAQAWRMIGGQKGSSCLFLCCRDGPGSGQSERSLRSQMILQMQGHSALG